MRIAIVLGIIGGLAIAGIVIAVYKWAKDYGWGE